MANCRFAFAVHILTVLAYKRGEEVNSDLLAGSLNTNAVVVRRLLGTLRQAGIIVTQRGTGGGARLGREPEEITLDEVYRAVEGAPSYGVHPHPPNQRCPVGKRIEEVLEEVFSTAQTALERALKERTLADMLETVIGAAHPE